MLEAIYRMQLEEELDPDEIQYIVWEREYLSDWSGSEYEDNYTVYIYKPPENHLCRHYKRNGRESFTRSSN